jgi:hypothetical protein
MAMATATALALAATAAKAGADIGGAALQSRANNRATDAQDRANREAIAYQRENEWRDRSAARRQWEGYMRAQYGDRFQPNAGAAAPAAAATPISAPASAPTEPAAAVPTVPQPAPGAPPPLVGQPAAGPQGGQTLAAMGPWSASQYGRYLGGR